MIWLILGLAPFVMAALCLLIRDPGTFFFTAAVVAVITACVLLAAYGGWQMGWFTHCGNFWESAYCS